MGSVRPVRRFHALRGLVLRPPPPPKPWVGPPCPCAPLQRHVVKAPHAPSCRSGFPDPAPVARAASRGFCCPTTLAGHRGSSLSTVDPSTIRATSGVWLPPSRPCRLRPPDTEASERPWASPSKAFPSLAMGTPLGAPALLTLPGAPSLREEGGHRGRLQGFVPAASPCCHPPAVAGGPSMPSWDFPLQSVPPIRPGTRF